MRTETVQPSHARVRISPGPGAAAHRDAGKTASRAPPSTSATVAAASLRSWALPASSTRVSCASVQRTNKSSPRTTPCTMRPPSSQSWNVTSTTLACESRGRGDDEDERVFALRVRARAPRGLDLAAQHRGQGRRRRLDPSAPRRGIGERPDLGKDHVAHAVPPPGLVIELRRGALHVGHQREGLDVVLVLVEQDHERARSLGMGTLGQIDDVLARAHPRRLRRLEPRRLLRVEHGAHLVGPRAVRVPLQVALRFVETAALVGGGAEGAVVLQVRRGGEHLLGDGAGGEGDGKKGRQGLFLAVILRERSDRRTPRVTVGLAGVGSFGLRPQDDSKSRFRRDSKSRFRRDSKGRLRHDSNGRLRHDSNGRLRHDSKSRLRHDSNGRLRGRGHHLPHRSPTIPPSGMS